MSAAEPGTAHPLWSAFLDRVTDGNVELQGFLQRFFGYCLTGETSEHCFVFAYGTGANGKSTLVNTIAKIFADYATIADVGTFIASNRACCSGVRTARTALSRASRSARPCSRRRCQTGYGSSV